MGLFGTNNKYSSVKEYVAAELDYPANSKWQMVDRSIRGNVVYTLITDGVDKMIVINVLKLCSGYWMNTTYTEKDHPYHYDCPKKFIKQSTIMDDVNAVTYKAECLKQQRMKQLKKKFIAELEMGSIVKVNGKEVVYLRQHTKQQFVGRDVYSNALYRYKNESIQVGE